jgi:hypothetical protein
VYRSKAKIQAEPKERTNLNDSRYERARLSLRGLIVTLPCVQVVLLAAEHPAQRLEASPPCHTVGMTFHDTLWVLTGSAAPVIALTAIVSLRDVLTETGAMGNVSYELNAEYSKEGYDKIWRYLDRWERVGMVQWGAQVGNLCLQALLLAISLLSVAWQRNVFPVWIAVAAPTVGVLLLAEAGIFMQVAKNLAKNQRVRLRSDLGLPVSAKPTQASAPRSESASADVTE